MNKPFRAVSVLLFSAAFCAATPARADVLEDFESGNLNSWTLTGAAWTVGGCTGGNPNICPPQGSFFARSGAPNTASEANTGTATSRAFSVTFDTLTWYADGWSGSTYNGQSYFQILDAGFNVKAQIAAPESDTWKTLSTNLIADGLAPGATFYFRAVDGNSSAGYAWISMDYLTLSGVAEAPEPGAFSLLAGILAILGLCARRFAHVNT